HGRKINPAQIPRDSPSSAHCDRAACSRATSCARSRSGEARGRHFQLVIRAITPRCAPHRVAPRRSAATLLRTAGKAPVTPRPDGFTMVYIQTPMILVFFSDLYRNSHSESGVKQLFRTMHNILSPPQLIVWK